MVKEARQYCDLQLRVVGQNLKNYSPSGGLEPPTFRLTVERASQFRHEGLMRKMLKCIIFQTLVLGHYFFF